LWPAWIAFDEVTPVSPVQRASWPRSSSSCAASAATGSGSADLGLGVAGVPLYVFLKFRASLVEMSLFLGLVRGYLGFLLLRGEVVPFRVIEDYLRVPQYRLFGAVLRSHGSHFLGRLSNCVHSGVALGLIAVRHEISISGSA
jgi:hypothetical protein